MVLNPRNVRKTENKVEILIKNIKGVKRGEKILVFTQFHDLTMRIAKLLDNSGI